MNLRWSTGGRAARGTRIALAGAVLCLVETSGSAGDVFARDVVPLEDGRDLASSSGSTVVPVEDGRDLASSSGSTVVPVEDGQDPTSPSGSSHLAPACESGDCDSGAGTVDTGAGQDIGAESTTSGGGNGGAGAGGAAPTSPAVPLGCDGALCSTANGSGCNVGGERRAPAPILLVVGGMVARLARSSVIRRHRRSRRSCHLGPVTGGESP
jgi:hypothetical protein